MHVWTLNHESLTLFFIAIPTELSIQDSTQILIHSDNIMLLTCTRLLETFQQIKPCIKEMKLIIVSNYYFFNFSNLITLFYK